MSVVIPVNNPSIYEALRTLVVGNQTLALLSPSVPPPGVAGFLFDVDLEQTMSLESDIPDHFVEDNTAVQDHIALRPERIVLNGLVAELVKYAKRPATAPQPKSSLPVVPGFSRSFSSGEMQLAATLSFVSNQYLQAATAAASSSLYGYYTGVAPQQPNQSRQSMAMGYFYQLWKGRILCTVDTPFGLLTDMAIESLEGAQAEESRGVSRFTIRMKRIRKASSLVKTQGLLTGRAVYQQAATSNNGSLATTMQSPVASTQILSKGGSQ